jgi:hypothetical protein
MTRRSGARTSSWPLAGVAAGVTLCYACGTTNEGSTPPVNPGTGDDASDAKAAGDVASDSPVGPGESGTKDGGTDAKGDGHASDAGDSGGSDVGLSTETSANPPEGGVLCNIGETWGAPTTVLTTAAADQTIFGAVTPDELTLAWTSTTGGVVTAWYADRASTSDSFGTPQALASSFGSLSFDRVTLSGDGLRIVGVAASGTSFVAAQRASRPGAFATDDSSQFTGLAPEGKTYTYATPLLSGDDEFFFYLVTSATDDYVVYESTGGPPWTPGTFLSPTELERVGTQYRRPTGMSADDLTLFYWDETTSTEGIAFRAAPLQDFSLFANIGPFTDAVPAASCSRIYYSVPATAGAITIVYADGTPPDD